MVQLGQAQTDQLKALMEEFRRLQKELQAIKETSESAFDLKT
jgi:molybdenum-dependent DNA-binding transcriptional regulator ModE